jgi:ABC-2 type transport system permease protein
MRILVLARHNARLLLREPGPALSRILSPLALIAILQPLYREMHLDGDRAVIMAFLLFSTLGLSVVANALLSERVWHTLDRLRATALRPRDLVLGKCAAPLAVLVLQQVVVFGAGVAVFGLRPRSPVLLGAMGLIWAVTVLCLGAALAAVTSTPSAVSAITDAASFVSTALSGALLPLSAMAGWVRAIAPVSPGFWAMRGFEAALDGAVAPFLTSAAVLLGVAVLAATLAARRLAR